MKTKKKIILLAISSLFIAVIAGVVVSKTTSTDSYRGRFSEANLRFEQELEQIDIVKAQENWLYVKQIFDNPEGRKFLKREVRVLNESLIIGLGYYGPFPFGKRPIEVNFFSSKPRLKDIKETYRLQCLKELAELDREKFEENLRLLLEDG